MHQSPSAWCENCLHLNLSGGESAGKQMFSCTQIESICDLVQTHSRSFPIQITALTSSVLINKTICITVPADCTALVGLTLSLGTLCVWGGKGGSGPGTYNHRLRMRSIQLTVSEVRRWGTLRGNAGGKNKSSKSSTNQTASPRNNPPCCAEGELQGLAREDVMQLLSDISQQ